MRFFSSQVARGRIYLVVSAIGLILVNRCAAPEEPSSLQTSQSLNKTSDGKNISAAAQSSFPVDYGGASVGDSATQEAVKKCLRGGNFYERRSNPTSRCTDMRLAKVSCTDGTIQNIMTPDLKASYQKMLGDSDPKKGLEGYVLDQCLDCPSATSNSYCEGTAAVKPTTAGLRLFLVKGTTGTLESKTVYIPR